MENEIILEFMVQEDCLTCSKKFDWWEVVIIKAPEWACFCQKCAEKYPDPVQYDWKENCFIVHEFKWKEIYEFWKI